MKFDFLRQFSKNTKISNFMKNLSSVRRVAPDELSETYIEFYFQK